MKETTDLKNALHNSCLNHILKTIETARKAMNAAEEAALSETKSSAGDKYETGRAMMHLEKERNEAQLIKAVALKNELSRIQPDKAYSKVEPGSLVFTDRGNFYISVGIGKLRIKEESFYAISIQSPLGTALQNKSPGDQIDFNGTLYRIEDVT